MITLSVTMDFRDAWPGIGRSTSCRSRDGASDHVVTLMLSETKLESNPEDPPNYLNPIKLGRCVSITVSHGVTR